MNTATAGDKRYVQVLSLLFRIATLLSQWRPPVPIYAVCQSAVVARQLHLWRGVFPLYYEG